MKRKPLQVSLRVAQPSIVELTVGDTVQLDRLTRSPHGCLAERCTGLLIAGTTTLHLDRGDYFFKTLTDAHLRIVAGGVVVASEVKDPKDPWPQPLTTPQSAEVPLAPGGKGDAPAGDAPALIIEHTPEPLP
jgi:hypothetical protein